MTGLIKPSFAATEKPTDLIRCTVVQLADLIRRREVSSLEVVNACLTRIEYVNPKLNAVVMLIANDARAQARVADQMMANNDAVGPLHGVPMTIKDSLDTAGVVTTAGTLGRKNFIPKVGMAGSRCACRDILDRATDRGPDCWQTVAGRCRSRARTPS